MFAPKNNFYDILPVRLVENPQWNADENLWSARCVFCNDSRESFKITFSSVLAPSSGSGDVIFAVYRGGKIGLMALAPDPLPRIGRICNYFSESVNKWLYNVQIVSFDSVNGNQNIPTMQSETTVAAKNLSEFENLETGLMGNGIKLSGFAPAGTPNNYLAPVPVGTLVFMFGYSWQEDQSGTNPVTRQIFLFQFQNQLTHPFSSHLYETTQDPLTGPSRSGQDPDDNHLTMSINGGNQKVYCPLLREGETIPAGTAVILSQNIKTGYWEIIEAQCPAAAALTGEEENGTGESGEDNPDNGQQPQNPEDGE